MEKNILKRIIIVVLSIIVISLIARGGYSIYKNQQMNKLIEISNELFNEYIAKGEKSYAEKNMTAKYTPGEIVIVAGDKKEFVSMIYFEVNIDVQGEKDYVSTTHKMRIKRGKDKKYIIVDEGDQVTIEGLENVNYSNKQKENKELDKAKKKIQTKEFEKSTGIYYQIASNGIQLSYDKKKTWIDVPIPYAFAESNIENGFKLKEHMRYISHLKTAFISTNYLDVMVSVTDDKGKTWKTTTIPEAYQGGKLFIGFSDDDNGYYVITTDVAMGKQNSYINVTTDGGNTWKEIGNTNEVYPHVITGVGFLDDKIGLVGFEYESDNNPTVYRTDDSGKTWTKLEIKLPQQYSSDYATPLSIKFDGDRAMLSVKLRENGITIKFISEDKGLTWKYSG